MSGIDAYLSELNRDGRFSGTAFIAQGRQTLLDQGYGLADREENRQNTPETAFQLCSVSKQFTAAAILLLQEQGALSVADLISSSIPGCPESWQPITIHNLLTHTSGIGHWNDFPGLSLFEPQTRENLVQIFQSAPLRFAPGTGWYYSSPAYVVLAHIVEQVSKQAYASFLHDRTFQALGMKNTGAGNSPPVIGLQAVPYRGEERVPSFELNHVGVGAGDVWSTTRDMAHWVWSLQSPGLLNQESLREMFTPHVGVPPDLQWGSQSGENKDDVSDLHYGYAWYIGLLRARRTIFHSGENSGFKSFDAWFPDEDGVVVLLVNDEQINLSEIMLQIATRLLDS